MISLHLLVRPGEVGMSREEHAGPSPSWPLCDCSPWGDIHRTMDRWLCIPESYQVRSSFLTTEKYIEKCCICYAFSYVYLCHDSLFLIPPPPSFLYNL